MSVERSGQAIGVETLKGQLVTGGARGFDEGRQIFIDGTSRMNREVQVRICEGLGVKLPGPTRRRGRPTVGTCKIKRVAGRRNVLKALSLFSCTCLTRGASNPVSA